MIPEHGPVRNKAGLLAYRNNIEKPRGRFNSRGKIQEEVGQVTIAEFRRSPNGLQMQWNLPVMMAELTQRA